MCFYYDKKFVHGDKCEGQLFSLIVLADNEELEEEFVDADDSWEEPQSDEIQPQISSNALSGVSSFQTLRVVGMFGNKHELHILVDSGTTHNFLDINMAKRLGCKIRKTCPLFVTVAGGRKLISVSECKGFTWKIEREKLCVYAMLLPLGGRDMVLGMQWLSTLGDIKCNLKELRMEFMYNGSKVALRGTPKPTAQ